MSYNYIGSKLEKVKEMTEEEFEKATDKALEKGFPHLAPCCKREVRGMGGGCLSCGDPCF